MSRESSPNQRMYLTKPPGAHPAVPGAGQAALQAKPTICLRPSDAATARQGPIAVAYRGL